MRVARMAARRGVRIMLSTHYTDAAGCVRMVTVEHVDGVRVERDLLTRQGRKEWARRVEAVRKRTKDGE